MLSAKYVPVPLPAIVAPTSAAMATVQTTGSKRAPGRRPLGFSLAAVVADDAETACTAAKSTITPRQRLPTKVCVEPTKDGPAAG